MKTLFTVTAFLGLLACGQSNPNIQSYQSVPNHQIIQNSQDTPNNQITLEEAIGEMLLVGFRGTEIDSTNHIWSDIKKYHVGSVILFDYDAPTGTRGRNIKSAQQVQNLCSQLRALSPNLLIGIDQEGGRVSRLSPKYGFPTILSPQRCAMGGLDTVRRYARLTAEMLHDLGINLNFAPVADVNVNPSCPIIGKLERSFSTDTLSVTGCCAIWMDEQRAKGVASCLKHFPGHGSAKGDTHKGLVDVTETWQRYELYPYRELAGLKLDMVMTAHVINRQMDPSGLPASLSPRITSYLRDSLYFNGVIVTDDLAMGAIADQYTFEQTIRMALDAGADLLCLSNNGKDYDPGIVPKVVFTIYNLIAKGAVTTDRIYQSALRVRELKENLSKSSR